MGEKRKGYGLLVFGIVLFTFWMGLFLFLAIKFQNGENNCQKFALSHLTNVVQYLSFSHFYNWKEVLITIGCYSLALSIVIIAILWIVLSIKTNQNKKIPGAFIPLLFIIVEIEALASFYPYLGASEVVEATAYFTLINDSLTPTLSKVFVILTLIFATFTSLIGLIYGFVGLYKFIKVIRKEKYDEFEKEIALEEEELNESKRLDDIQGLNEQTKRDIAILIRDIVREELEKQLNEKPRIIQNFYGYVPNDVNVKPVNQKQTLNEEADNEEPVVIAPIEEEKPVIEEVEEKVVSPKEKEPIIRISFKNRMISSNKEMKDNYNELKNELLSWGLKSRLSSLGDSFRLHCRTYCKLTIAGKSLKLYLALNPKDYSDSTFPFQDVGDKDIYKEIPFAFKVRSGLSMRRAKLLIRDACEAANLEQGKIENIDWAKELEKDDSNNEE